MRICELNKDWIFAGMRVFIHTECVLSYKLTSYWRLSLDLSCGRNHDHYTLTNILKENFSVQINALEGKRPDEPDFKGLGDFSPMKATNSNGPRKICFLTVNNFWISLIETNYAEFEWSDCEALGYSNWDVSEPNGNGMCVGFNITNFKWQTFSCDEEFQVICEEKTVVDKCWFEEFVEVRFSETDRLIGYGGHSLKTCQNSCLGFGSDTTECIMISFENTTGVCRLLDQPVVRLEGTPPSFPSPTFITYVKRCYDYYVSGDEIVPVNKLNYPETNCTEVINITTSLFPDSTEYIATSIIDYSSVITTIFDIANQTPMVTEIIPSNILCPCKCFATVELANGTKEAEIIAEIKKELIVNTTTLSSFKRKLYSAEDSRSSVEVVGSIAIGFLGSLLLIVAMLDFHHFIRGVQNIFVKYKNRDICIVYQPKRVENNIS
ncbi:hypothetical protein LOTGIDRAFT_155650 [Lottia gigantea]|uniref:C-type lectin domain-containing protein n=1 Tax=Lottia gigantea TaxID=225164 RepID=V3ZP70_LOTGI|nr:hypothetical protein LOTGIDRAFT_155650 [Lottia gigantea]ESO82636.1 hypothetical protein LOTGIDRAFT_155650 [Lottia gigantea]